MAGGHDMQATATHGGHARRPYRYACAYLNLTDPRRDRQTRRAAIGHTMSDTRELIQAACDRAIDCEHGRIDYAEYAAAKQRAFDRADEMERENKRLRLALEYYARTRAIEVFRDNGALARAALAGEPAEAT